MASERTIIRRQRTKNHLEYMRSQSRLLKKLQGTHHSCKFEEHWRQDSMSEALQEITQNLGAIFEQLHNIWFFLSWLWPVGGTNDADQTDLVLSCLVEPPPGLSTETPTDESSTVADLYGDVLEGINPEDLQVQPSRSRFSIQQEDSWHDAMGSMQVPPWQQPCNMSAVCPADWETSLDTDDHKRSLRMLAEIVKPGSALAERLAATRRFNEAFLEQDARRDKWCRSFRERTIQGLPMSFDQIIDNELIGRCFLAWTFSIPLDNLRQRATVAAADYELTRQGNKEKKLVPKPCPETQSAEPPHNAGFVPEAVEKIETLREALQRIEDAEKEASNQRRLLRESTEAADKQKRLLVNLAASSAAGKRKPGSNLDFLGKLLIKKKKDETSISGFDATLECLEKNGHWLPDKPKFYPKDKPSASSSATFEDG